MPSLPTCLPSSAFKLHARFDVETVGEALLVPLPCLSSAAMPFSSTPSTRLADGPILKHKARELDLLLGPRPPSPDPVPSRGPPGICGREGAFSYSP